MPKILPRRIQIESWTPCPRPTKRTLRQKADYYEQRMIKFDGRAEFHSYQEYLKGGLNEGDVEIESWCPQPFRFRIAGKFYTPDAYIKYRDGRRVIEELKPRAEFNENLRRLLEDYCAFHGVSFAVIANESVVERELLAQNWLSITRRLVSAKHLDTEWLELDIFDKVAHAESITLGDIVDPGDPDGPPFDVAVFRLCQRGKLHLEVGERPLDYDARVSIP